MNPLWRIDTGARIVSQNMKKNSYIRESDFHGRNAVAPLKLQRAWAVLRQGRRFPRQKCRGPIEAISIQAKVSISSDFHGRNAVAPLKRESVCRTVGDGPDYFHGRNAVAPLMPVTAGTIVSAWFVAPARKDGRGLKPTAILDHQAGVVAVGQFTSVDPL